MGKTANEERNLSIHLLVELDTLQMSVYYGMESSMISLFYRLTILTPTLKLNTGMQSAEIRHYYCWVAGITTELSFGWTLVKFMVNSTDSVLQNNRSLSLNTLFPLSPSPVWSLQEQEARTFTGHSHFRQGDMSRGHGEILLPTLKNMCRAAFGTSISVRKTLSTIPYFRVKTGTFLRNL